MQGASRDFLRRAPYASGYVYEYVNYDELYFTGGPWLTPGKERDRYNRYEGVFSLGGYIIKDKVWFFGSFNPSYNQTAALRDFRGALTRQDPALLETFKRKNKGMAGSLRLTATPLPGLRISAGAEHTRHRGSFCCSVLGGTGRSWAFP